MVSGVVRQYLPMQDGRQVTVGYAEAGDLVGGPYRGSRRLRPEIEAIEPAYLLHLDAALLERTAQREPDLSMALAEEVTNRLVDAYRTLVSTAFATVRSRVARDLLERAGRTGRTRKSDHLRVTQQALADATGSVREVVARALRELRQQGAIETDQAGVTILNVDALIAEAGHSL